MSVRKVTATVWAGQCAFLLLATPAWATPDLSLTAGTPCATCHVNPTGGGGRTPTGFVAKAAFFDYESIGLGAMKKMESPAFFDGLLNLGIDMRVQAARLGNPTIDRSTGEAEVVVPGVTVFPMQLQPYLTLRPTKEISIYGTFLMGPNTFRGQLCDEPLPGMPCVEAFAMYEPTGSLPTFRAGLFQPAIGIRHDDHTLLVRGDARNRRRPIIPPNYAEPGFEVTYQPFSWLRSEVGAFVPFYMDRVLNGNTETADLGSVAYNARLTFTPYIGIPYEVEAEEGFDEFDDFGDEPETEDYILNSWFGVSAYLSGDFMMLNGFMGVGIHEGVSLVAEVSHSRRTLEYETLNGWLGVTYSPWPWLSAMVRGERAQTTASEGSTVLYSAVASLQLVPLPFLEIRPEYRFVEARDYRFGQATAQVYLYY